jgi:hypothetical protein
MPIGPARPARALEPQAIDLAQEMLANVPIVQALAAARRIEARQTDRRALPSRPATGRPQTETERPGARNKVGRRDVRPPAQLLESDIPDRLPEGSEQPHPTAVEDSEAVVAAPEAAEAAAAGVDRT